MGLFGSGGRLQKAAKEGDVAKIQALLSEGKQPDKRNDKGKTALVVAAKKGHVGAIQVLVMGGAGLHFRDGKGRSPLMAAVSKQRAAAVEALLCAGCDIDLSTGEDWWTVLHEAAKEGNPQVLQSLLRAGGEEMIRMKHTLHKGWETPLHVAAAHGKAEAAALLLGAGAKTESNERGQGTPLHIAARCGHAEVITILCEAGANPNALLGQDGDTPLHLAAQSGHANAIRALLAGGAKLTAKKEHSPSGATALHLAAEAGSAEVIEALLQRFGSNRAAAKEFLEAKEISDRTALYIAAQHHKTDAVKALLKAGADPMCTTSHWDTPLHACGQVVTYSGPGHERVTIDHPYTPAGEALLAAGADPDVGNKWGETPLGKAEQAENRELAKMMKKAAELGRELRQAAEEGDAKKARKVLESAKGQPVKNYRAPRDGCTALHYAALNGRAKVVRLLLDAGVDARLKTHQGHTALELACKAQHMGIAAQLSAYMGEPLAGERPPAGPAGPAGNAPSKPGKPGKAGKQKPGADAALPDGAPSHYPAIMHPPAPAPAPSPVPPKPAPSPRPSPLLEAAREGNGDKVQELVLDGADLAVVDPQLRRTALHLAALFGHADVAAILLANGANPVAQDSTGYTPLHLAAAANKLGPLQGIAWAAASQEPPSIDARTVDGRTALHLAAANGRSAVAAALMGMGASVSAMDKEGDTPMHLLLRHWYKPDHNAWLEAARTMLAGKADLHAVNHKGETPLSLVTDPKLSEQLQQEERMMRQYLPNGMALQFQKLQVGGGTAGGAAVGPKPLQPGTPSAHDDGAPAAAPAIGHAAGSGAGDHLAGHLPSAPPAPPEWADHQGLAELEGHHLF